jgi:small-conductance mechanosensitive channel
MSNTWLSALGLAVGVLVVLELLFVVLRRSSRHFKLNTLYHLWALSLAALLALQLGAQGASDSSLWKLLTTVALLLSALVFIALVDALVLQRPWEAGAPSMVPKLAMDVLRVAILAAVAFFAATQILGYPVSHILVSSTVLSAVIGLALQDTLRNVFSGMAIDLEKPFKRGDWLLLDGSTRVQVIDMSWRSIRLRTKEGIEIYEPNGNMANARLLNYGNGSRPVAVSLSIGLPYGVPPAEAMEVLRLAAKSAPDTLDAPPVRVFLESFDDSAITYGLRIWTRRAATLKRFKSEINTRIWYGLKRSGIDIPFPIRTVHLHEAPDMAEHREHKALHKAFELLSEIDIFQVLDEEVVRQLGAVSRRRLYDVGEPLVTEGDAGDSLFVIERGSVQVVKADASKGQKAVELAVLEEGAFFGEMSLLTGEPRSATVSAREHCGVLTLSKEALAPILEEDPRIAESFSRALAARERDTAATLEDYRATAVDPAGAVDEQSILERIRTFFSI